MKKWRNTILLFIFASNFVENISQENVNSGLRIGDICIFNETIKGVCSKINKCDYITENAEYRKRIPEEIKKSLCLSKGRQQLVCCPSLFKPQDMQTNKKDETKFEKATCVNKEPQIPVVTNIISGEMAEPGEFQFQATIGYTARGSSDYLYRCGGALIAEDIVITSASCLRLPKLKLAVVKIGATSLNNDSEDFSESEDIEIQTSIPHPQYSRYTGINDIGLIKLQRPVSETSWSIAPICLSTNDEYIPQNFTITGYRINFGEESTRSNWLLKATSIIHPNNHSRDQIYVEGYKGIESCFGDLGGPLFYEINFGIGALTYLYGVKLFGHNCSLSLPSIYTKVTPYIQWIKETMESLDKYDNGVFWS